MLKIYTRDAKARFQEHFELVPHSWVHLTIPNEAEIIYIADSLGVPVDFIHHSLDSNERTRLDNNNDQVSLIINVPVKTTDADDVPYKTVPIGIVHTKDAIVTICRIDHPMLQEFSGNRVKHVYTDKKVRFLLQLLFECARYYLRAVNDIDHQVTIAEKRLQKSINNKDVYYMFNLNKSLVYFIKSLRSIRNVLQIMMRASNITKDEADEQLMQDALIEIQQALDASDILNANVSGLMDAYSAVIENNVSSVVKTLTAFTLLMTIPMAVATIYGMNFPMPIQDKAYAFPLLMSASVMISLVTGWVFHRMRIF